MKYIAEREFGNFILNESRSYLGQKVGTILTALQELREDGKNMGTRDLAKFSERVVNQIRSVLHSDWPREERKGLRRLQKVAVAIMKAIEDKGDLLSIVSSAASELEELTADLGVPVNKFLSSGDAPDKKNKGTANSEQEIQQQQQAQQDNWEPQQQPSPDMSGQSPMQPQMPTQPPM